MAVLFPQCLLLSLCSTCFLHTIWLKSRHIAEDFFFFTLMQRKLNTVHMLELNAVLQMKLGYSSCVCVYKEGPLPQIILIIEPYLPADACNQQNMAAGFYVPSCSQLLG